MNKLAIVLAVAAAALLGGSAANAADNAVRAKASTDVMQQSTDFSSSGRHYRNYRPYGYRNYRPYYGNSYGYAPRPYYSGGYGQPYYGGGGYGYGGPNIRLASAAAAAGKQEKRPAALRAFSFTASQAALLNPYRRTRCAPAPPQLNPGSGA